jgi:sigma-E factor negative regulatory protein RseA
MTNRNPDKISTLVDDELAEWEMTPVMRALRHDPEMQACWRNYHLIGDAMRGSLPKYVCVNLTERVSDALEHEPVFIKPESTPPSTLPGTHTRSKATIGFALAASMTAIAVFGVVGIDQETGFQAPATSMVSAGGVAPAARDTAPVPSSLLAELVAAGDGEQAAQRPRIRTVSGAGALPVESDLYEYLMNYQQFALPADHDDALLYLRMVSHGSQ